ncbi:MAG TPA: N(4)-(beta-N-acetylglucosaminyl)-L-asparaginase [Terriglobia bacterium]|nr:N(4)-(beta-N-acetylglucosaminyl)-L-asparaginase [Terriglobia bacterium]
MDPSDRRTFIKSVAGAAVLAAADLKAAAPSQGGGGDGPVFLSTWPHGKPANERAAEVFKSGGSLLDAIEKGINVPEDDPKVTSVGYGGLPNEDGVVELDAAIMDGTRHRAGSVCNLHMIKNPISVARQVIEKTRHTTLAGDGAFQFALKMGFQPQQLLTPDSLQKWLDWKANPKRESFWMNPENHDTIGFVATDGKGHVVSGCSTSGLAWKISGRVADSPLVGCGVYADDNVGAASATGDGDVMTNYCTSVSIVHSMARGASPQDACVELLQQMAKTDPKNREVFACVIAINNRGEIGAASMNSKFALQYALWKNGESKLLNATAVY